MIPVYNCTSYLQQALESVLIQDPGPDQMQIEVIDDASTDGDVAGLVAAMGKGRVGYFRQDSNVGSLRNFETCLNRSRGQRIHLLHGDDYVQDGYYQAMNRLFDSYPDIGAAFCRQSHIDEKGHVLGITPSEADKDGILESWLFRIAAMQRIQYCSISVKRTVYEHLGGFFGVTYGEDWEMWIRMAHKYSIAYTPAILATYRQHPASISGQSLATGQNLRDLKWVIDTVQHYLPPESRRQLRTLSLKNCAHGSLGTAHYIWRKARNKQVVEAQIRGSLSLHQDIILYVKIVFLYSRMLLNS